MAFIFYNSNPCNKRIGDCVIRAIALAMGIPWINAYTELSIYGLENCDMPSSNSLWGNFLREHDFQVFPLVNKTTIKQFSEDNPIGTYILATGDHVVTVINGDYYDTWDSGDEIIAYYFKRA